MPYNTWTVAGWWIAGLASLAAAGLGIALAVTGALARDPARIASGGTLLALVLGGRFVVLALAARPERGANPSQRRGALRVQRADGRPIEIETDGSPQAPPLVMVHDWGLGAAEWAAVRPRLARHFRLLMPNLPGHGHSPPRADDGWQVESLARDLRRVIECAGRGPVLLLGHGAGGLIVLAYCRLFPRDLHERVAGLVLASTEPAGPLAFARGTRRDRAAVPLLRLASALGPLASLAHRAAYASGLAHLFAAREGFALRPGRQGLDRAARMVPGGSARSLARGALALLKHDERATLRTVAIPSLVIAGTLDRQGGPAVADGMRRDLDGEWRVLEGAGPLAPLEHPLRLTDAVERFADECLAAYA